jgi:hypothetical protein
MSAPEGDEQPFAILAGAALTTCQAASAFNLAADLSLHRAEVGGSAPARAPPEAALERDRQGG